MQDRLPSQFPDDPVGHCLELLHVIIELRDHEVGDLQMPARGAYGLQGLQHRLQPGACVFFVKVLIEPFQVDAECIGKADHIFQRLRVNISVGHHNVLQSFFPGQQSRILHIFIPDDGFVIGVGDADIVLYPQGCAHRLFRGELAKGYLFDVSL